MILRQLAENRVPIDHEDHLKYCFSEPPRECSLVLNPKEEYWLVTFAEGRNVSFGLLIKVVHLLKLPLARCE